LKSRTQSQQPSHAVKPQRSQPRHGKHEKGAKGKQDRK
jgi:hypothetical protein